MPRMATRCGASSTIRRRTPRRATSVVVSAVAAGVLLPSTAGAEPGADPRTVRLPAGDASRFDAGMAGWTAATQVTASGCMPDSCPLLTATWRPDAGARGVGDGAITVALAGVAAHAGVAVATLRSPIFLTPATVVGARLSLSLRTTVPAAAVRPVDASTTVRLIDVVGGERRTIVDSNPVAPVEAGWTDIGSNAGEVGALRPASLYRLEIDVRFSLAADDPADTTILIDGPALEVETAPVVAAHEADPVGAPTAPPPTGADALDAARLAPPTSEPGHCEDPLTILGASGSGRRLTVTGVAEAPAGSTVTVASGDGWGLGETQVRPDGTFSAALRSPAASGRTRLVLARAASGEQSAAVRVQRQHVLGEVRRVGTQLVIGGTIAPRWLAASRRVHLDLLAWEGGVCGRPTVVDAGEVRPDSRTGRYRARIAADGAAGQHLMDAIVVAARFSRAGQSARMSTSAPIVGPGAGEERAGP